MIKNLIDGLWATKIFFFVRFVASLVVVLCYILVAAAIQHLFVSWFGENTFNYIVGGSLSLLVGASVCIILGKLVFMFVSGWHIATFALYKQIQERNMPMMDTGIAVFKRNFTSFAAVYTVEHFVTKFSKEGAERLWELLKDVPYLGSLSRFVNNPIVCKVSSDILSTSFDAMIYYLIRFSRPGISDDLQQIPKALKKYVFSLPSILVTSLSVYLLFYVLPRVLKWIIFIYILFHGGIVAGILQLTLLYPVFFLLRVVVFDPVERMALLTCFATKCTDEVDENSGASQLVNSILESAGVSDLFDDGDSSSDAESNSSAEEDSDSSKESRAVASEPEVKFHVPVSVAAIQQRSDRRVPSTDLVDDATTGDSSDDDSDDPPIRTTGQDPIQSFLSGARSNNNQGGRTVGLASWLQNTNPVQDTGEGNRANNISSMNDYFGAVLSNSGRESPGSSDEDETSLPVSHLSDAVDLGFEAFNRPIDEDDDGSGMFGGGRIGEF